MPLVLLHWDESEMSSCKYVQRSCYDLIMKYVQFNQPDTNAATEKVWKRSTPD